MNNKKRKVQGFTLIEILLVLGIISIMASTLIFAINPAHQFAKARDAARESDIIGILSTVTQYAAEHSGALPDTDGNPETSNFPAVPTCIGTTPPCFNLAGAGDVGETIVPVYMVAFPMDPQTGTQENTGYFIHVDENNHLIGSATPEATDSIVVSR